jgi:hypothetical protein
MTYRYLGSGNQQGTLKYRLSLKLYKYCASNTEYDQYASFTIFNTATSKEFKTIQFINKSSIRTLQRFRSSICIPEEQENNTCFNYAIYQTDVDLPPLPDGYTVSYQRCCRGAFTNMNSAGVTYFVEIPGNSTPGAEKNSSSRFTNNDDILLCTGQNFTIDFSASDADSDSLSYSFAPPYTGGGGEGFGTGYGTVRPHPASPPSYIPFAYKVFNGFFVSAPLGTRVTIDPKKRTCFGSCA